MVSLPRQSQNEETIFCLKRIIDSARTVGVTHVSKYARYGRKTIGWMFIPQPDYKNMIGWFRLVFKKKYSIVTYAIKNEIAKCCMLFIRNGVLHD